VSNQYCTPSAMIQSHPTRYSSIKAIACVTKLIRSL